MPNFVGMINHGEYNGNSGTFFDGNLYYKGGGKDVKPTLQQLLAQFDEKLKREISDYTVARSDNTAVSRRASVEARRMDELAAERAVRERKERRSNPRYAEERERRRARYRAASAKADPVGTAAGLAADAIDVAMIGASMIPGYGGLAGLTYWGDKGAKDVSDGNYLLGVFESLPFGYAAAKPVAEGIGTAVRKYAEQPKPEVVDIFKKDYFNLGRTRAKYRDSFDGATNRNREQFMQNNSEDVTFFGTKRNELPSYISTDLGVFSPIDLHISRLSNGYDRIPSADEFGKGVFTEGEFSGFYRVPTRAIHFIDYNKDAQHAISILVDDLTKQMPSLAQYPPVVIEAIARDFLNNPNNYLTASSSTGNVFIGKNGEGLAKILWGDKAPQILKSHEIDHAVHIPTEEPIGFISTRTKYFKQKNGTELAARGSQIKDYYGLADSELPITESMLKYASDNYVKDTGVDNNMTDLFKSIADWNQAAGWLSRNATDVAAPMLIIPYANENNE